MRGVSQKPARPAKLSWHQVFCRASQLHQLEKLDPGIHIRTLFANRSKQWRVLQLEAQRTGGPDQIEWGRGDQWRSRLQLCLQLDQLWQKESRAVFAHANGSRQVAVAESTVFDWRLR